MSTTGGKKGSILILADNDQEKNKWVGLLNELHRLLKKNKLKERFVYMPKEAYDSTLPLIKTTQSAAIIGTGLMKIQKQMYKQMSFYCFFSVSSQCCYRITVSYFWWFGGSMMYTANRLCLFMPFCRLKAKELQLKPVITNTLQLKR